MALDERLLRNWLDFDQYKKKFQIAPVKEYPNNVVASMPEPVVSVRITTYQHASYIEDALEGVLRQDTKFPFEIVLGDDGSTDGTREICIEYARKYPEKIRLFLHSRENARMVLGRVTGIFQIGYNTLCCRGKYITGCSGDDYWQDGGKLRKQVSDLEGFEGGLYSFHEHVRLYVDSGAYSGPYKVERVQTIVGRNIFQRLPEQFLNIMQEDRFFKFFWESAGRGRYTRGIKPCVIRMHGASMYSSLEETEIFRHQVNVWNNIVSTCQNDPVLKTNAEKTLIKTIIYRYRNRGDMNVLFKYLNGVAELFKLGLCAKSIGVLATLFVKKVQKR